jgi:hypothetical protein
VKWERLLLRGNPAANASDFISLAAGAAAFEVFGSKNPL